MYVQENRYEIVINGGTLGNLTISREVLRELSRRSRYDAVWCDDDHVVGYMVWNVGVYKRGDAWYWFQ